MEHIGIQDVTHSANGTRYKAKLADRFINIFLTDSDVFSRIPIDKVLFNVDSYIRTDRATSIPFESSTYGCIELSVSCEGFVRRYYLLAVGSREKVGKTLFSKEKISDFVQFFLCADYIPKNAHISEIKNCLYSSGIYESTWTFIDHDLDDIIKSIARRIEEDYIERFPIKFPISLNEY
ncbi:hypothetical protein KI743_21995 [Vibrio sp. D420a]|uniref:hypothetical protein n=1 Tax=Vibrio sp. D420a TaxID=2836895 RepID=UPI0025540879|nr:hypothetical protein [Vibrio sp. D420a]MDK9764679.1 hypothetical protein [Vibrio sp. D420a]